MVPPPLPSKDLSHLRTLAICHFVAAGLNLLALPFIGLHYLLMNKFMGNPELWKNAEKPPPFDPAEFIGLFRWFYLGFGMLALVGAVLALMSGLYLRRQVNRTFSIVVAALSCLQFPLGTLLGIFTLIVLCRDSVEGLYAQRAATRQA